MNPIQFLTEFYTEFKNANLSGRYITFRDIEPELKKLGPMFSMETIGYSVLKNPIPSITFGHGSVKILAWSQMHGNESTTTKALFDIFNLFERNMGKEGIAEILDACTIKIIPMLNPDGAARYTRENVNEEDINRDAQNLKEPESRVLRACFDLFQPHFCFNLHDQRTIFGAGDSGKPATISFLAPALDDAKTVPESRKKAMQLIAGINKELDPLLPGQIGRFDDSFNLNCTGDTYQALNASTLLFEAGHYQNDYLREESRKFMCFAIFLGLYDVATNKFEAGTIEDYLNIPDNKKNFYDIILRNAIIKGKNVDVAIQFEEKVKNRHLIFIPVIKNISVKIECFAHREIDCKGNIISKISKKQLHENDIVHHILLNSKKLTIKT